MYLDTVGKGGTVVEVAQCMNIFCLRFTKRGRTYTIVQGVYKASANKPILLAISLQKFNCIIGNIKHLKLHFISSSFTLWL